MSEYRIYSDGTLYLNKIKTDRLYDVYRCVGCGKSWRSSAKKMGHQEATCRRYR
jgi:hypothetical protein